MEARQRQLWKDCVRVKKSTCHPYSRSKKPLACPAAHAIIGLPLHWWLEEDASKAGMCICLILSQQGSEDANFLCMRTTFFYCHNMKYDLGVGAWEDISDTYNVFARNYCFHGVAAWTVECIFPTLLVERGLWQARWNNKELAKLQHMQGHSFPGHSGATCACVIIHCQHSQRSRLEGCQSFILHWEH